MQCNVLHPKMRSQTRQPCFIFPVIYSSHSSESTIFYVYIYIYMYLLSYIITSHILSHFCYPLLCPQKSSTTYLIPCSSYALYTYIHTHIHSPRFHPASYISQLHQPVTSASYISQLRYSNHPFFFDVPQISKAYIIYLIYIYTYHDIS